MTCAGKLPAVQFDVQAVVQGLKSQSCRDIKQWLPSKHDITCLNWARTGPPGSGPVKAGYGMFRMGRILSGIGYRTSCVLILLKWGVVVSTKVLFLNGF